MSDSHRVRKSGTWRALFLALAVLMLGVILEFRPVTSVAAACAPWVLGMLIFVNLPLRRQRE